MYNPKRITIPKHSLLTSSLILFLAFLSPQTEAKTTVNNNNTKHNQVAVSTCEGTLYPQLCVSTLASFPGLADKSLRHIISDTVSHAAAEARASSANCTAIENSLGPTSQRRALDDCLELLDETAAELDVAVSDLATRKSAAKHYHDLETLLSGAMTNQYTCLEGFFPGSEGKRLRRHVEDRILTISSHVSNILVMLKRIKPCETTPELYGRVANGFPGWVSHRERRLLEAAVNETKPDLVVAKDGSGNFTTVSDAVSAAPNNSQTRFVIYIKGGVYMENVEVVRKKTNLMFIGDGIGKTIIKANRNHVDGWTTFRSATVAVVGNGFMAKGITIENSAGPSKHQAVALRSGSDLSTFFQCSFVGYQDTLYPHSLRQFYRDCNIYGTVDFLFGNAAAVLQNCNLYARRPNPNQHNIFTAQGREDPNMNTGFSLINCKLAAASDLAPVKSSFKTYLGRPWKEYSRTVIMTSFIDDLVQPAGWLEWNGSFALSTLYYGEYMNRGPGSNTTGRVTWPGYRVINSSAEAGLFTVEAFIQGTDWLNATRVPYFASLS